MAEPGRPVDLSRPTRVHVVGIGGAGMSAIATVLAGMGHEVTGSDRAETAVTARLRASGIAVALGHDADHVAGASVVTASSAVADGNPELAEAARLGLVVVRRAGVLAAIAATRRTVAVAGTHGKTTTSSMLFEILRSAGWRPSCVIGGDLHGVGGGAVWEPDGAWLVVEADESDGTFLDLPAEAVVVGNVESDHLDFYGGLDALRAAFAAFVAAAPGPRVVNLDDPGAARLAGAGVTTFGTAAGADLAMGHVELTRAATRFAVTLDGVPRGDIVLGVPGLHNAHNAAAAAAVALRLGVDWPAVVDGLARFRPVARRFQWRGEADGVTFIDDYGHLPTEVAAALATARVGGFDRVVAVFQPHRYSRTADLHEAFADAFVDADVVVLTGVYPAGEAPRPGVTGALIEAAVRRAHPEAAVSYVEARSGVADVVRALVRPGDAVVTLGAGDLWRLPGELGVAGEP